MTQRKRKPPEKKPARKPRGLISRAASALMGAVVRRPAQSGGIAAFVVVFGVVAANALWYQPGRHPQPFFRTRDSEDFTAMAGLRRSPMIEPDPATVTTFRIERESSQTDGAAGQAPAAAQDDLAAIIERQDDPALVRAVQQELANRKLYLGTVDGVSGRGTSAAITAYQRKVGLAETGLATPELLATLQNDTTPERAPAAAAASDTAAVPLQRPTADSLSAAEDPVAAAIRDAEKRRPVAPMIPPAPVPNKTAPKPVATAPAPDAPQSAALNRSAPPPTAQRAAAAPDDVSQTVAKITGDAELTMAIQRGLSNIAYADVTIDGVAGEQTRAAIRHFERHYRLPETGEPNPQVLKKLKDIGAL